MANLRQVRGFARNRGLGDLGKKACLFDLTRHEEMLVRIPWLPQWKIRAFDGETVTLLGPAANPHYDTDPFSTQEQVITRLLYSRESLPSLEMKTYEDVYLVAEGGSFLVFRRGEMLGDCYELLSRVGAAAFHVAEPIVVEVGAFCGDRFEATNPAHFMFDHLARAVIFNEFAGFAPNQIFVQTQEAPLSEFSANAVMPGFSRLSSGQFYFFRKLSILSNVFSDVGHPLFFLNERVVATVRRRLAAAISSARTGARRIYVSRFDATRRPLVQEAALADALRGRGFEVLVMSALSPEAQLRAFRDAEQIVAPHGAALANLLGCSPGVRMLELFSPSRGTAAFCAVCKAVGGRYGHLVGTSEPPERRNDHRWSISVDDVVAAAMEQR